MLRTRKGSWFGDSSMLGVSQNRGYLCWGGPYNKVYIVLWGLYWIPLFKEFTCFSPHRNPFNRVKNQERTPAFLENAQGQPRI